MRVVVAAVVSCSLVLALVGPVAAAKPDRGCPNPQFTRMDYQAFRDLSLSVGVPEEFLGPEHFAVWEGYDKNEDGLLCVKDLPDTPGTFEGWVFNVIDNTANR